MIEVAVSDKVVEKLHGAVIISLQIYGFFTKIEPGAVLYRSNRILFRPICGARALVAAESGIGRKTGCAYTGIRMLLVKDIKNRIFGASYHFFVYLYQAKVRVNFVSAFRPDAALPPGRIVFAKMACISGGRRLGLPYRPVVFVRTSCGVVCRIRHWLRLELFFGIRLVAR